MKEKLKEFSKEARAMDFKNNQQIAEELVSAIKKYNEFQLFLSGNDNTTAALRLKDSGTQAFRAMEFAYKNYLYHHYESELASGAINLTRYNNLMQFQGVKGHATHQELMELFTAINPNPVGNVRLILQGAQQNNNDPKHNATVPDPKELKMLLI